MRSASASKHSSVLYALGPSSIWTRRSCFSHWEAADRSTVRASCRRRQCCSRRLESPPKRFDAYDARVISGEIHSH